MARSENGPEYENGFSEELTLSKPDQTTVIVDRAFGLRFRSSFGDGSVNIWVASDGATRIAYPQPSTPSLPPSKQQVTGTTLLRLGFNRLKRFSLIGQYEVTYLDGSPTSAKFTVKAPHPISIRRIHENVDLKYFTFDPQTAK